MHFVAFVPASNKFHLARKAMDGVLPDGTNLREAPYNMTDANTGINAPIIRASHGRTTSSHVDTVRSP